MSNPFNPGAGRKPPFLAGRENIMRAIRTDMERVYDTAEGARPVVVSGLRGMGKTVLLREMAEYARQKAWVVAFVEASPSDSLASKLARELYVELRRIRNSSNGLAPLFRHALAVLQSFQLRIDSSGTYSIGIDIEPAKGFADSGDLSADLNDLFQAIGEAARDAGTAVLIVIDELQETPKEDLQALNRALHSIGQGLGPVPVYFLAAGLPTLPAILADATSYAERMYRYYGLDLLKEDEVREAYVEPTMESGVTWDNPALELVVDSAAGYPYFIQQCGFCVCELIEPPICIDEATARSGIALAQDEVDRGLYRSRWDRATPKGKEMMSYMAVDNGHIKSSELAKHMGKNANELSVLREQLIRDGIIYAPERGYLDFTVPGMASFIRRRIGVPQ